MSYNETLTIIRQELKKSGYRYEERNSISTDSIYFKIYSGDQSLLFRVADHNTNKDVITLRVDHRTNEKIVRNFIRNRIDNLSYRVVKSHLGMMPK